MDSESWINFPTARGRFKDRGGGRKIILRHGADAKITELKYIHRLSNHQLLYRGVPYV
jgi:hypothetical protein